MKVPVAFIIGAFWYGGAERDLLELLRRLDRRRYDLHVLYVHRKGENLARIESTGAALHPLGISSLASLAGLRAVRRARSYMREHGVRILQGFGVYGSFYAAVIARGIPGVRMISYEFTPVPPASWKAKLFQCWYQRRSDVIVCNSDAVRSAVSRRWGARGRELVKIHNGVDVRAFAQAPPAVIDALPPGAPVVGAVGRLNTVKGHDYLVAAWPRVVSRFGEARLLLVGPAWPHDRARVERAVRGSGHSETVLLLGPRSDVARLLHRMDVVVVPSLAEGFSNVVLEAGAAGRPVVATRVGGNPEAILHGETGLLVPARDPDALAEAILELLSDTERRSRMGEAARRRISELFGVERMIEGYDRLYASLAGGGRA